MNALVIFYLHKLYVEIKDKIKPCEAYPTLPRNLDDFSAKMITFQGLFKIEGTKGFLLNLQITGCGICIWTTLGGCLEVSG